MLPLVVLAAGMLRSTTRLSSRTRLVYASAMQPMPPMSSSPEALSLQISSPALLLNHMAERYSSTSRILMEFIDNSLDDAEAFYDTEAGAYSRSVSISVHVSREDRTIRIVDDCRGMAPPTLSRVVMRVGESRKRGASFVNGQFGFGMQAFRAACSSLTVLSRTSAPSEAGGAPPAEVAYQIQVDREKSGGFQLQLLKDDALAATGLAGTTGAPPPLLLRPLLRPLHRLLLRLLVD